MSWPWIIAGFWLGTVTIVAWWWARREHRAAERDPERELNDFDF
jgi:hypothetical protein